MLTNLLNDLKKLLTYLEGTTFCTRLSNPIKIGLIWVTDLLNLIYNPFKDLTRSVDPKYQELLFVKAQRFENDLLQNFLLYGTIWNYRLPLSGPVDTGDQILHHGMATAYWATKYSLTKDPGDLLNFSNSVKGMHLHQTIHGESKRRIIRGFRQMTPDEQAQYQTPTSWTSGNQMFFTYKNWIIEDSPSNDSASGHLFGIYYAWKYGTPDIQMQCAALIRGLADELLGNNYSLVNADGSPTQFGQLIQGVLTDPLRLSLCLAVVKVAHTITGDASYEDQYVKLLDMYGKLSLYAKVKLWWWDNDNDTPRSAMQLAILSEVDHDRTWRANYIRGLSRVWRVVKKTGNTLVSFLDLSTRLQYNSADRKTIQAGKDRLSEFSLEDKQTDIQKINSTDTAYLTNNGIKLFQWNGHLRSSQPLPIWKLPSQDSFWQRNLNSVDGWIGQTQPTQKFNGMDFLLVYIIGRKLGFITVKE